MRPQQAPHGPTMRPQGLNFNHAFISPPILLVLASTVVDSFRVIFES